MTTLVHRFTLLYSLPSEPPTEEELMGGLLAAGCNDALVGLGRPGHVALEFERAALDRDTAFQTAQLAHRRSVARRATGRGSMNVMTPASQDNLVFRTVYVDADVDAALRGQAAQEGVSKGQMFRKYLETGMALGAKGRRLPALVDSRDTRLCMRTVFLPPAWDAKLEGRAFMMKTPKTDLIRQYLRMGMDALAKSKTKRPRRASCG
jgi:hypothetical protein